MNLKRHRDVEMSRSVVWRIRHRFDLGRLPPRSATSLTTGVGSDTRSQCEGTGYKSTSSYRAIAWGPQKHYKYTSIDDCTRMRVLRIYDRHNQKTAIQLGVVGDDAFDELLEL